VDGHQVEARALPIVISHFQAREMLAARHRQDVESSLDLGRSRMRLEVLTEGIRLTPNQGISWALLEEIAESDSTCFRVARGEAHPIRAYSEEFSKTFSLYPTESSPAMLISGFVMHRIKEVSPSEGAKKMVRALGKVRGRILDTATGLGYAAIEAARSADEVVTVELDPTARLMCRENPWSSELFSHPKIRLLLGPSERVIETFADGYFSALLHDPPAISVAGDLYGLEFYRQAHRVLGHRGRMFHYIGDPKSQFGSRTTAGTVRRLHDAGFRKVTPVPDAFGVLAFK
jgi:hypothetical protein